VLINTLFFFGVRFFAESTWVTGEELRDKGEYSSLAGATGEQSLRSAAALLKLGDLDAARVAFLQNSPTSSPPSRQDNLRKAIFLRSKDDIVGAEQLLANTMDEDPSRSSLFLWVRAYFFCLQNQRVECEILAEDSIKLDPLSPLGLQIAGSAKSAQRDFVWANELFVRAEKLNGRCADIVCRRFRGMHHFYRGQYTGALADLTPLADDELHGYEIRTFLWRTYLTLGNFSEAVTWFERARDLRGWTDWMSELWLARVASAQNDTEKTRQIYTAVYESGEYGVELLTDFLTFSHYTKDVAREQELIVRLDSLVGRSAREYLIAAMTLRYIGLLDTAWVYIEKWVELAEQIPESAQREKYLQDFKQEEHHLLVSKVYQAILSGQSTQEFLEELDLLAVDERQIAFLRGLISLVVDGSAVTENGFQLLPEILPIDLVFIRFWYVIFRGDTVRALEILTEMSIYDKEDTKILRLKRAVTKRLNQPQLADRYLFQLREQGEIVADNGADHLLRKQSFSSFKPWIDRMSPYFAVNSWWLEPTAEQVEWMIAPEQLLSQ
jgi:tetratricopeptide (TPR) repeat protein